MTDLSPAAQAVRKAYYSTDDDLTGPALAAALRAAADQVVPVSECSKNLRDNCCERSIKQERSDIRILLRDIAFELEAQ